MEIIGIVILYLSGCAFAYLLFRKIIRTELERWTVGDRSVMLAISSLSYISLFAAAIVYLIEIQSQNNKKAKW